jgi:Uri superfamily endonuclease
LTEPQREPGTYALLLRASRRRRLRIGRLGDLEIRPGFYVYVGSAFGPGGVRARVRHHRARSRRPHWHVDHLRRVARPCAVWYSHDRVRREHGWAALLARSRGASVPLAGFGASDCACGSHLIFFASLPPLRGFRRRVRAAFPDQARVESLRLSRGDPDGSER